MLTPAFRNFGAGAKVPESGDVVIPELVDTLEWVLDCPPTVHQFDEPPVSFWYCRYNLFIHFFFFSLFLSFGVDCRGNWTSRKLGRSRPLNTNFQFFNRQARFELDCPKRSKIFRLLIELLVEHKCIVLSCNYNQFWNLTSFAFYWIQNEYLFNLSLGSIWLHLRSPTDMLKSKKTSSVTSWWVLSD